MLDTLCCGKLIQTPVLRTGASGKQFTNFLLSVSIGEDAPIVVSGIAFGEASENIAKLAKGDPLAVIGSLKPSSWSDKNTNEIRHGLSIVTNNSLSSYDITKRKPKPKPDADSPAGNPASGDNSKPYNDEIEF